MNKTFWGALKNGDDKWSIRKKKSKRGKRMKGKCINIECEKVCFFINRQKVVKWPSLDTFFFILLCQLFR